MRKLSVEICGGSDLIIRMTFGTSLWMYFVPQKYENDKWMSGREYEKSGGEREGGHISSPGPS